MKNKKKLINQIIYRSMHRGTKEMDIILGSFVKKNIKKFNYDDLSNLHTILNYEDEFLYKWYFEKNKNKANMEYSKIMKMLKDFKV